MNSCPQRADGVKLEEVADGFIVHQPAEERVHYLNHTAAMILEMCNGQVSVREMAAALQGMYDLAEMPTHEVEQCLHELRKQGLVT